MTFLQRLNSQAGRVEFKMDKTANVAVVVGKRSFNEDQISENTEAAIKALVESETFICYRGFSKKLNPQCNNESRD